MRKNNNIHPHSSSPSSSSSARNWLAFSASRRSTPTGRLVLDRGVRAGWRGAGRECWPRWGGDGGAGGCGKGGGAGGSGQVASSG